MNVTLRGTWLSMKAETRHFLANGGGNIVNIASIAGLNATPNLTPYGASKHGVVSLTRSGAQEYATDNIRINAVAPARSRRPLWPRCRPRPRPATPPRSR